MKVDWRPAGEVLSLQRRSVDPKVDESYTEIGVRSFARGLFLKEPITGADIGAKRVFKVEPGDLVVSNIFAWEGAVAVADDRHAGTIGSHRFMTWTANMDDAVVVPFLAHYFASEPGLAALKAASPGSAGRNRTLSIKNFEQMSLPIMSSVEMGRIAAHLDRIRDVSDGSAGWASPKVVRGAKARVLSEGCRGAAEATLGEFLDAVPSAATRDDKQYPIAGVFSFGRGLLHRPTIYGHQTKYQSLTRLESTMVVYSKLGAFEGAVAMVEPDFNGTWVSPEFPTFEVIGSIDLQYLRHYLTSAHFERKLAAATAGVGARQKRVAPRTFLAQTLPIPVREKQEEIARVLERMDGTHRVAARAQTLRAALLPAARNEIFNAMY